MKCLKGNVFLRPVVIFFKEKNNTEKAKITMKEP